MAAKVPIRTVYTNSVATGLAEFQSGEFIDYTSGGTGLAALGSAGQVLKVNSGASALEYGTVEAILNIDGMTDGSSATIAATDKLAFSDGGTEKYLLLSQIDTLFTGTTQTLTNKTLTAPQITSGVLNTGVSGSAVADEDNMSSNSATKLATQQSIKAYVDAQVTAQDLDFIADSGGALSIDLDSESLTIAGGTGIDTVGSGNSITASIDSTVTTLTGSQTLTNKTLTAPTITGTAVMATLDISGDVDVDGTLETDALTIAGVTIAETIADTVGAMVGSNTETGITVTYEDGDNTLDFALGAAQTTITSLLATDIKIGEDDQTKIDFETADEIHLYAANAEQVYVADGIFGPQTDSDVDLGTTGVRWKDAYIDTITATGVVTAAGFTIGSAAITETELEILDGASVSTAELNYLDITTLGTSEASKAVTVDSSGDLIVPDSDKFKFGAGSDMQVYHDGTNSYITNATGALKIATETSGIALTIGHSTSEVTVADNLTVTGTLTLGSNAELTEAELEFLDGITAGTAAASKALVLDGNKDIGTIRNLTIDGVLTDGNYTFDTSGNVSGLGTVASGAITSSGVVTGTGLTIGSASINEAELETIDGVTAGTVAASKAVVVDANKDISGFRHMTIGGNLLPSQNNTYNIGSSSLRFNDLFLAGDTIDLAGATISSDGTGAIAIAASGATLPTGSKTEDGNALAVMGSTTSGSISQPIRRVDFFSAAGGLSTKNATFEFNAEVADKYSFLDNSTFTLENGSALTESGITLFQL